MARSLKIVSTDATQRGLPAKTMKDMLPILHLCLESPTHAIIDKALGCLPTILTVLDFSSIKNELFPVVASVFSKTSSLGIKVRGLEAFVVLCGGTSDEDSHDHDDFNGITKDTSKSKQQGSSILDKYTVQEKVVPLLKVIKTKEPAVMMAALAVFKQVGKIADAEFLALETLPILWSFSLGPLLNLQQFQQFMDLIKKISSKIEGEQMRKLRDLSLNGNQTTDKSRSNDLMDVVSSNGPLQNGLSDIGESDFERLVLGSKPSRKVDMLTDTAPTPPTIQQSRPDPPMFSWSSPRPPMPTTNSQSRTITPDQSMNTFNTLSPITATGAQSNMQRTTASGLNSFAPMQPSTSTVWPAMSTQQTTPQTMPTYSGFPSTQSTNSTSFGNFALAPPPIPGRQQSFTGGTPTTTLGGPRPSAPNPSPAPSQPKKSGLDAFESLL